MSVVRSAGDPPGEDCPECGGRLVVRAPVKKDGGPIDFPCPLCTRTDDSAKVPAWVWGAPRAERGEA